VTGAIDEDIRGFDVLVYQAAGVYFGYRGRDRNRQVQEFRDFQRLPDETLEQLAAGILQQKDRAACLAARQRLYNGRANGRGGS